MLKISITKDKLLKFESLRESILLTFTFCLGS